MLKGKCVFANLKLCFKGENAAFASGNFGTVYVKRLGRIGCAGKRIKRLRNIDRLLALRGNNKPYAVIHGFFRRRNLGGNSCTAYRF